METLDAPTHFGLCDCPDCVAFHTEDDYEQVFYTAHEMADTWTLGSEHGAELMARRLYQVLKEWLEEVD
jgi:hypothetical protein